MVVGSGVQAGWGRGLPSKAVLARLRPRAGLERTIAGGGASVSLKGAQPAAGLPAVVLVLLLLLWLKLCQTPLLLLQLLLLGMCLGISAQLLLP